MTDFTARRMHTAILLTIPGNGGEPKVVLQRRSNNPQITDPAKLGCFGGRVEEQELTPNATEEQHLADVTASAQREMEEELPGLAVNGPLYFLGSIDFEQEHTGINVPITVYFFRANTDRLPERVAEGDGAEAYTVVELAKRTDLAVWMTSKFDEIFGGLYGA